jgi:outer membrane lipoprotein-sorting protein
MRFAMSKANYLLALAAWGFATAAHAQGVAEIVARADAVRNPTKPFRITVTLTDYKSGRPIGRSVYTVFSKLDPATRQFRDVMIYLTPPRDAGKILLLSGRNLWFYDPAAEASVRISPQEKLSGQASAGDVLTENLAVDYRASLVGSDTIDDGNHGRRDCWHLTLEAANDAATYDRVEYWVEKTSYRPIKAKFYADSGALLKTLYYRNYVVQSGRTRPTQAVIIDAIDPTLVTTADFSAPHFQIIPDAWFEREYLPHLSPQ